MTQHKPDSQCTSILNHLKRRPITQLDAFLQHGCFRLAARINDLRQDGHTISTHVITQNNKRFASYTLEQ